MTTPADDVDRIPLTRSVHYAVRGMPEVPNQYGAGVLAPSEITLTYREASDSQLGRVHAYVAGRIWVDGKELPLLPGGLYGQYYFDGLDGWPEWLAGEARLHDPAAATPAGPMPATDRDTLRQRITTAVDRVFEAWRQGLGDTRPQDAVTDAVLAAVLPAPDQRSAVLTTTLREVLDTFSPMKDTHDGSVSYYDGSADIEPEQYERWRAVLDSEAQQDPAQAGPRRGDQFEQWLTAQRDAHRDTGHGVWSVLDTLLDQYRQHANTEPATDEAQQGPAQDGEARPPRHAWRVETRDPLANEWAPGSHFASRPHAVERYETANRTAPLWRDGTPVERRLVRETTTYTVEETTAVARSGQPETDEETPVHAIPDPDDNGISPCCGRRPFDFRGEHLTRDPAKVTCTGPST